VLSERTFYRRLNARRGTEQTARRKGARAAYQNAPWYWELSRSTPRHGDRPWEIVHLDHTELDIEVCTSMGRVLGRPWATFATDAYSRRLLGCYLSFDPPSYRSCMMVLRACVRRYQRYKCHLAACYAISARYKQYAQQRTATRVQQYRVELREAARRLHEKGVSPTRGRIEPLLQSPGILRDPTVRQLLVEVCREIEGKKDENLSNQLPEISKIDRGGQSF